MHFYPLITRYNALCIKAISKVSPIFILYIKKESLTVLGQHEGELTTFNFWMSYSLSNM